MTGVVMAASCMGAPFPVAFQAAGVGAIEAPSSGGSIDIPYPSGIVSGNVLILHMVAKDATAAAALTAPSGWTSIASVLSGGGLVRAAGFYKIADGTETGNLAFSHTSADADVYIAGRMYRFSPGASIESGSATGTDTSSTTMSSVAVTTTGTGGLAVQLYSAAVNTTIGDTGSTYTEATAEYANAAGVILSCQVRTCPTPESVGIASATLGTAGTYRQRIGFGIKR